MSEYPDIFCKILATKPESEKFVYENDIVAAFLDFGCVTPLGGHTLIIPKEHYRDYSETPDSVVREIGNKTQYLAKSIMEAVKGNGVMITNNLEAVAGQKVFHAHFHIIPRSNDDGMYNWSHKTVTPDELSQMKRTIELHLKLSEPAGLPEAPADCDICTSMARQTYRIYEDNRFYAFLPTQSMNPGHTILATKQHYQDLFEAPEDVLGELLVRSKEIGSALMKSTGAGGLNMHLYVGKSAGQRYPHLYLNLIPRFEEDNHVNWKPAETRMIMDKVQEAILAKSK